MITVRLTPTACEPGAPLTVNTEWRDLDHVERMEIRLFWFTSGKGDQDVQIAATDHLPQATPSGQHAVTWTAPTYPHSFSGNLISLTWAVEVVTFPGGDAHRVELVIAPHGQEILLARIAEPATTRLQ